MSSQELNTFCLVGEADVTKQLEPLLTQAGFTAVKQEEADVILSYCISTSQLEDLYYDTKGLLTTTKKDAYLVDLSPSTVSFARELYAMGAVNNHEVLDAPLVVRNVVAADAFGNRSNLGIVCGGEEKAYSAVRPLLSALASQVLWMGKAGTGQSTKVALTISTAASLVGLVEAYASFKSSEIEVDWEDYLDAATALDLITPAQEAFLTALQEDEVKGASFTIEHLMAELSAALTSVDDGDAILPQAESGYRLMELLAMVGGVTFSPAALRLVFADEETGNKYGLDWSRAEGAYDHADDDHECDCDHDDPDHECECGHHHHHHQQQSSGFMGFSSN